MLLAEQLISSQNRTSHWAAYSAEPNKRAGPLGFANLTREGRPNWPKKTPRYGSHAREFSGEALIFYFFLLTKDYEAAKDSIRSSRICNSYIERKKKKEFGLFENERWDFLITSTKMHLDAHLRYSINQHR